MQGWEHHVIFWEEVDAIKLFYWLYRGKQELHDYGRTMTTVLEDTFSRSVSVYRAIHSSTSAGLFENIILWGPARCIAKSF